MNRKKILLISAIFLSPFALFSQTQTEMNQRSYAEFLKVENDRQQTISKIKILYSDQAEFLLAFADSEKIWEDYRNAFLEMMFPGENKTARYGTVFPMVYSQQKARLTQRHIQELQIWINGIEEGDIGWGSVRLKHATK